MEVATFGPPLGWVLGQRATKGQDPTEAALALLKRMPLPGQRVTLDAGRIGSPVIRKMVEKKEVSRGPIQGHLPELVPAIRLWLQDQGVWERTPDVREAQRGTVGWSSGS